MNWQVASFSLLGVALVAGFAWYERSRPSAKVLALVAALVALAVVGRIAFAPIPNVKPTTDIVLLSGYALGGAPGFCVGAVTALVSNVFFSHGPWTPWQMAAWGGVGIAGAGLAWIARGRELGRAGLAAACGLAGLGFGVVMDLYVWTLGAEQTAGAYAAVSARSLPFNLAHALGNVAFCLLVGPALVGALRRYRRRLEVSWPAGAAGPAPGTGLPASGAGTQAGRGGSPPEPGAAGLAAALVALIVAGSLVLPAAAHAATSGEAARYLERAQNRDGGFGSDPRAGSNQLYTGWAALGLAAAGRNSLDVVTRGRSVIDYVRRNAGSLGRTGDLSRTILVLEAAGISSRSFARRNLVEELRARRQGSGAYDGLVNQTAFAILALRAAGSAGVAESARWIAERQNRDGGFGFDAGTSSPDVTGAALQALAAAGRRGSDAAREAVDYLAHAQRGDGGLGQLPRTSSNAQSTAFAVQGLVAVGRNPERLREGGSSPLDYLRSLQRSDGSIGYARGDSRTPVWVTAQALPALEREAFPLSAVARAPGGGPAGGGATGAGPVGGSLPAGGGGGEADAEAPLEPGGRDDQDPGRREDGRPSEEHGPGSLVDPGALWGERDVGAVAKGATAAGARGGGSVLGGLIAAAASAVFVVGVRRRLRKRIANRTGAPAREVAS